MLLKSFAMVQTLSFLALTDGSIKDPMAVANVSLPRANHPLLNPSFRRLWMGMAISFLGRLAAHGIGANHEYHSHGWRGTASGTDIGGWSPKR